MADEERNENDQHVRSGKRMSYSTDVVRLIIVCYGIVFILIFITGLALLYLAGSESFFRDSLVMFGLYLILYVFLSVYITDRIRRMFAPLDRFAGYEFDEAEFEGKTGKLGVLAKLLNDRVSLVEDLSGELKSAREDIDEINEAHDSVRASNRNVVEACLELSGDINDIAHDGIAGSDELSEETGRLKGSIGVLRDRKELLINGRIQAEGIAERAVDHSAVVCDIVSETGAELSEMLAAEKGSEKLVEDIYDSMSMLQDLINRVNLYSVNAAVEVSKSSDSYAAVAGVDEVKRLSEQISGGSDEIMLKMIKLRNDIKLSAERIGNSGERLKESDDLAGKMAGDLKRLEDNIIILSEAVTEMEKSIVEAGEASEKLRMAGKDLGRLYIACSDRASKLDKALNEIM
ncbi:MAG: methyl-accepting chemotaxis protein [Lachnospiraceae bacterium]|nr:methyl-accepting chemotaxis protein [Lachnospiraceae bacterium]